MLLEGILHACILLEGMLGACMLLEDMLDALMLLEAMLVMEVTVPAVYCTACLISPNDKSSRHFRDQSNWPSRRD